MARIHRQDGTALITRAIAPGVVLWGVIVGIGLLLKGPLISVSRDEESISRDLANHRTTMWNNITAVWSHLGNTEIIIGVCLVVAALLLWRTRDWRLAATPVIAIALQATIFVIATHMIGRARPNVPKLDPAPPTSSFPSGHVGASFALYLSFALLAMAIHRTWLRWSVTVLCMLVPFCVSYARLYRGMHHVTDVGVGLANGVVCALLAYGWYRHRTAAIAGTAPQPVR
ncbi:MAG TPA: phosphatase PAP2 family protein [Pedococcus sp.]|jgi:undecaprenyl-diphosphatase|nr:phosphatase PAP2 family protein [Pedococcus sp.]